MINWGLFQVVKLFHSALQYCEDRIRSGIEWVDDKYLTLSAICHSLSCNLTSAEETEVHRRTVVLNTDYKINIVF